MFLRYIEYLESVGLRNIEKHEAALNSRITKGLADVKNVSIIGGSPEERGGVTSFNINGIDSREAALMLDSYNVLVRGGFHCCHNWFNVSGINGSVRASLYLYNNEQDADKLVEAVKKVAAMA